MNIEKILLKETEKAYKMGEIPVACVIVKDQKIISKAHNTKQRSHLTINHAEILAISKAQKKLKDWRLNNCVLYVSLEPCNMCKEVIRQSRISQVYYIIPSSFTNENNKTINYKQITFNDNTYKKFKSIIKSFFHDKR